MLKCENVLNYIPVITFCWTGHQIGVRRYLLWGKLKVCNHLYSKFNAVSYLMVFCHPRSLLWPIWHSRKGLANVYFNVCTSCRHGICVHTKHLQVNYVWDFWRQFWEQKRHAISMKRKHSNTTTTSRVY